MAGDSSTQITAGSGDRIYDEDIGGGVKMPASKIHTGALGADGGPVTTSNPLPVAVQGTPAVTVSGVATAAAQATGNASLASIDGHVIKADTDHVAVTSALPAGTNTIGKVAQGAGVALAGAWATVITDGSGTILGTGSVPLSVDTNGAAVSLTGNLPAFASTPTVNAAQSGSWSVSVGAALPAGTNVIGHVIADSGSTTAVTSLPAIPSGSNTIGKIDQGTGGASAWKVDGSAVTQPVSGTVAVSTAFALEAGNLATITARTPALGQALAAASSPVVLPSAQDVVAYAGSSNKILVTETSASGIKSDLDTLAATVSGGKVLTTETSAASIATNTSNTASNTSTIAGAVSSNRMVISLNSSTALTTTKLMGSSATGAWLIKSGAGRVWCLEADVNVSGGNVFVLPLDRTTLPITNDDPKADSFAAIGLLVASNNSGAQRSFNPHGRKFSTGLVIVVTSSLTAQTFTSSDTVRVTVDYE